MKHFYLSGITGKNKAIFSKFGKYIELMSFIYWDPSKGCFKELENMHQNEVCGDAYGLPGNPKFMDGK